MTDTVSTTEAFIPYNQHKDYLMVDIIQTKTTESSTFPDILVVKYKEKEYELYWNEWYSYYIGKLEGIEGFIP